MLSHDDSDPRPSRGDDAPIGHGLFGRLDRGEGKEAAPRGGKDGRAVSRSPLNR